MISNLDASAQQFLASLSLTREATARAQQQISSGLKVQTAADAPDQISELLQLGAALALNTQIKSNLQRGKAEVDSADSVLTSALQITENATVIATQALGTTVTAQSRAAFAQEIQGIQEQLVAFTNTSVEGRYIFSGDQDGAGTYQLNLANANGVARLATVTNSRKLQDTAGNTFSISKTAQDIFDHRNSDDSFASDNLFLALNNLRTALLNNDVPGITAAVDSLHQSADYVNLQQGFYGNAANQISSATDAANARGTSLKSQIADIQDADLTEAALQLSSGQTQQQASLAARAKLPKTSLFDFLG